ncbi:hypothetical protein VTL71DRAFT_4897 [Oculimacula yallundae]|uniref:Uncharacterized protein n=1 Tax=Oculimacula yallundae TaxID=86028 RepID=A0ABR4C5N3_9HELO
MSDDMRTRLAIVVRGDRHSQGKADSLSAIPIAVCRNWMRLDAYRDHLLAAADRSLGRKLARVQNADGHLVRYQEEGQGELCGIEAGFAATFSRDAANNCKAKEVCRRVRFLCGGVF